MAKRTPLRSWMLDNHRTEEMWDFWLTTFDNPGSITDMVRAVVYYTITPCHLADLDEYKKAYLQFMVINHVNIHHKDGDHFNNSPNNLLPVSGTIHKLIHRNRNETLVKALTSLPGADAMAPLFHDVCNIDQYIYQLESCMLHSADNILHPISTDIIYRHLSDVLSNTTGLDHKIVQTSSTYQLTSVVDIEMLGFKGRITHSYQLGSHSFEFKPIVGSRPIFSTSKAIKDLESYLHTFDMLCSMIEKRLEGI